VGSVNTNQLSACSSKQLNNSYDNAILYTDYFLSEVIKPLKQNDDRFETVMFYDSGLGEALGLFEIKTGVYDSKLDILDFAKEE